MGILRIVKSISDFITWIKVEASGQIRSAADYIGERIETGPWKTHLFNTDDCGVGGGGGGGWWWWVVVSVVVVVGVGAGGVVGGGGGNNDPMIVKWMAPV